MTADAQTQALLDQVNTAGNPQLYELSVAEAREGLKTMTLAMDAPVVDILRHENRTLPGPAGDIPVRVYWPLEAEQALALPVLLLFHGGGFALGDLDTHHKMARYYCQRAGLIVLSVDYRRSPEHPFPAGVEDCYAALCWTAENAGELGGDPARIAVTGDSAGGNLSAVMCLLARQRGGPSIAFQALVYPVVDMRAEATFPSRDAFGAGGYFLSQRDMDWLNGMYYANPDEEARDLRSSPILARDLAGLPPALVITAGLDPLRDEGRAYADRLTQAGVAVRYRCFESTIHGFLSFSGALDAGKEGLDLVADTLREQLHG